MRIINTRLFLLPLLLLLLNLVLVGCEQPQDYQVQNDQRTLIALREIGHQLALAHGDSTTVIPPVQQLKSNYFQLSFNHSLSIEPEFLVAQISDNLSRAELGTDYLVEVKNCLDKQVVYSYEMAATLAKTIVPCGARELPSGCYQVGLFFYEPEIPERTNYLIFGAALFAVLISLMLLFLKRRRDQSVQNYTPIGIFRFYPDQNKLVKAAQEIGLSNKECELLTILAEQPNQIIKREEFLKRVWEDNGVIVGRSLDTYISKLRKKLGADERIQIINVHGVGYKLQLKD